AVKKFIQIRGGKALSTVIEFLPQDVQDYQIRFGKMLINPENHFFFIISTLLAEWANNILGDESIIDKKMLGLVDDLGNIFEFVSDDISLEEQQSVLKQAESLFYKYDMPYVRQLTDAEILALRKSMREAHKIMSVMD
ncbi:hypothetical protein, partial [Otariodibacter sp.]|uniref:hypothetical protein n=1 Tax=Otariodibacter sp. TaxID=3030919 RepID=UPI002634D4A9